MKPEHWQRIKVLLESALELKPSKRSAFLNASPSTRSPTRGLTLRSVLSNTAHEAFEFLHPRSPIPLLHIVEVVAEAAKDQGCTKLEILGTRFLMEGKVYPQILSRSEVLG